MMVVFILELDFAAGCTRGANYYVVQPLKPVRQHRVPKGVTYAPVKEKAKTKLNRDTGV